LTAKLELNNNMNNEIKWKRYPLEVEHDGETLKGEIVYWAKDYRVELTSPLSAKSQNLHMMYMIPARFVTPLDTDPRVRVKDVDIVDESIRKLKLLFEQNFYKS